MLTLCLAIHCAFGLLSALACAENFTSPLFKSDLDGRTGWRITADERVGDLAVERYSISTVIWRGQQWSHLLEVIRPLRPSSEVCGIQISGSEDGTKSRSLREELVRRTGIPIAVITEIPNQPLFEGRKEDALIAYSFHRYLESGDSGWPLLFPMVEAVRRGLDVMEEVDDGRDGVRCTKFIAFGASKRGWTTWLLPVADPRIVAIAPMVFDMLHMKGQIELATRVYGKESEKIKDYTELGIIERIEEPRSEQLRRWVDPYEYRERLELPKLLLLGTNDPYWVVNSLELYYGDLRGSTLVHYVPNGGHHISSDHGLRETLAVWMKLIADSKSLPVLSLRNVSPYRKSITLEGEGGWRCERYEIWHSTSEDQDFRDSQWGVIREFSHPTAEQLSLPLGAMSGSHAAFFGMLKLVNDAGESFSLSTPVFVTSRRD